LHRVYFPSTNVDSGDPRDPDRYHKGVAPAVRMLHETVVRLCEVDAKTGQIVVKRWSLQESPIHLRLWAAMARDRRHAQASEVGSLLKQSTDEIFWYVQSYPEIAEVRATRFSDLSKSDQTEVANRILKGPPISWFKRVDKERQRTVQNYWIARELRRLIVAGSLLPDRADSWYRKHIESFPEIREMSDVLADFSTGVEVSWTQNRPDDSFDLMSGINRLQALEDALSSEEKSWAHDVAGQAEAWLRQPGRLELVIKELIDEGIGAARFPAIWSHIGWYHRPPRRPGEKRVEDEESAIELGRRTLRSINGLSTRTLEAAIDGLSSWFDAWADELWPSDLFASSWLRTWPLAVSATNASQISRIETAENESLRSIVGSANSADEQFDSLNNPTGRMVEALMDCLPHVKTGDHPFADERLRAMRDAAVGANGYASLVARHRLTMSLDWFLVADRNWALKALVEPLKGSGSDARILWMALAHGRRPKSLIAELGTHMLVRAQDLALARETRKALVFSLLVDCLFSLKDSSAPAVPNAEITQMIRGLEDEVRGFAASVPLKFLRDLSTKKENEQELHEPEEIAGKAIIPFMKEVWPQERSL
jgi:hypothetical protein